MSAAKGHIFFGIFVACPTCEADLNLMDDDDCPGLNEEGEMTKIFKDWINNKPLEKHYVIHCRFCKNDLTISELEY